MQMRICILVSALHKNSLAIAKFAILRVEQLKNSMAGGISWTSNKRNTTLLFARWVSSRTKTRGIKTFPKPEQNCVNILGKHFCETLSAAKRCSCLHFLQAIVLKIWHHGRECALHSRLKEQSRLAHLFWPASRLESWAGLHASTMLTHQCSQAKQDLLHLLQWTPPREETPTSANKIGWTFFKLKA